MKKILLFASFLFSFFAISAQSNKYYAWVGVFDDLEVGKTFPVVDAGGNAVEGATAVVEADANDPDNKVLHVTTGQTAGFVKMDTPDNISHSTILKRYTIIRASIRSANSYDKDANCHFKLFLGNYSAYEDKNTNPTVLTAGQWKTIDYTPLATERNSLSKEMRLGLMAANADYYLDDICFLCSTRAFELEAEAIRIAHEDSIYQAQEAKFAEWGYTFEDQIDQIVAYDFNDYEIGATFPVYTKTGTEVVEGAQAVVVADPKNAQNKVLHISGVAGEKVYVELDNPTLPGNSAPMSAATLLKNSSTLNISILANDQVSAGAPLGIVFGKYYAHKTAPKYAVSKISWVDNTLELALERNSLSKTMRLGIEAEGADYYIDDLIFICKSYDMSLQETTVRYWADKIGKNFGTCVNPGISNNDDFGKTVSKNFNMVVLENAMKFDATEPRRNSFSWNADGVVQYAKENKMKVRGHTLTWHGQNPDWVANTLNALSGDARRQEAINILKNHIYNVVGHWKGQIAEWDVVNECLEENQGRAVGDGYATRNYSVWYTGFGGEDYIDSAFVWAHQADPDAKLYINDYNIGHWGGGHYENGKTHAMYNLAKRLKDAGIPIDGVGMQMHTSVTGLNPAQIDETIKQFKAIGLNCIITEMDMPGGQVQDKKCVREISEDELRIQAEKYAAIADIMIKHSNAPTFLVWGVRDNQSWLDGSEGTKPLLFFADLSPHQAYIDVRKAYQRRVTVMTDVDEIFMDDDVQDPVFVDTTPKTVDVYDILGRKIASCVTADYIYELPDGLYIVGGKKVMICR